ncbi:hypothetical protein Hdeb2414_s0019g00540571 [Helianthus debilis subsp. tardiflorus]
MNQCRHHISKKCKKKYLKSSTKLLVQQKARKLSSARPLKKLNKDLPKWALNLIRSLLKLLIPDKMGLVIICFKLLQQGFKLSLIQVLVHLHVEQLLHFIEVCRVEPWCK